MTSSCKLNPTNKDERYQLVYGAPEPYLSADSDDRYLGLTDDHWYYNETPYTASNSTLKHITNGSCLSNIYEKAETQAANNSEALRVGSMIDCFVTEQSQFYDKYSVYPKCDRRTKLGKKTYADWLSLNADKEPISHQDIQQCKRIHAKLMKHPRWPQWLKNGQTQQTGIYKDDQTGIWLKFKADLICTDTDGTVWIIDLKTTHNAGDKFATGSVQKWGYYQQGGWYRWLYHKITGVPLDKIRFVLLPVEKEPPHTCTDYELDPFYLDCGLKENLDALTKFKTGIDQWIESGEWPGYGYGHRLSAPNWLIKKHEQLLIK